MHSRADPKSKHYDDYREASQTISAELVKAEKAAAKANRNIQRELARISPEARAEFRVDPAVIPLVFVPMQHPKASPPDYLRNVPHIKSSLENLMNVILTYMISLKLAEGDRPAAALTKRLALSTSLTGQSGAVEALASTAAAAAAAAAPAAAPAGALQGQTLQSGPAPGPRPAEGTAAPQAAPAAAHPAASSSRAGNRKHQPTNYNLQQKDVTVFYKQKIKALKQMCEDQGLAPPSWHAHPHGHTCTGCDDCRATREAACWPQGIPLTVAPANLPQPMLQILWQHVQDLSSGQPDRAADSQQPDTVQLPPLPQIGMLPGVPSASQPLQLPPTQPHQPQQFQQPTLQHLLQQPLQASTQQHTHPCQQAERSGPFQLQLRAMTPPAQQPASLPTQALAACILPEYADFGSEYDSPAPFSPGSPGPWPMQQAPEGRSQPEGGPRASISSSAPSTGLPKRAAALQKDLAEFGAGVGFRAQHAAERPGGPGASTSTGRRLRMAGEDVILDLDDGSSVDLFSDGCNIMGKEHPERAHAALQWLKQVASEHGCSLPKRMGDGTIGSLVAGFAADWHDGLRQLKAKYTAAGGAGKQNQEQVMPSQVQQAAQAPLEQPGVQHPQAQPPEQAFQAVKRLPNGCCDHPGCGVYARGWWRKSCPGSGAAGHSACSKSWHHRCGMRSLQELRGRHAGYEGIDDWSERCPDCLYQMYSNAYSRDHVV